MKSNWVKLAGIASELTALIIAAVLIGQFTDKRIGSNGVVTVSLIILVFCGWFVRLIKVLNKQNLEETNESEFGKATTVNSEGKLDDSQNSTHRTKGSKGNDA
jgi:F0F1-type ATP synthase assembly protein I